MSKQSRDLVRCFDLSQAHTLHGHCNKNTLCSDCVRCALSVNINLNKHQSYHLFKNFVVFFLSCIFIMTRLNITKSTANLSYLYISFKKTADEVNKLYN